MKEIANHIITTAAFLLLSTVSMFGCNERSAPEPTPSEALTGSESERSAGAQKKQAATSSDACPRICQISEAKGCDAGRNLCLTACQQMTNEPECRTQMIAALDCMKALSPEAWNCGQAGFPELKSGHCEEEQRAMVTCLSAGP